MASSSNVSGLIIILLSYNCEVSSGNNFDTQIAKIEDRLQTMTESIFNLKRDLQKESTERRENTEVLNRKISQYTCEIQDINQQQNFSENVRVGSDILGCVDPKKVKSLERGLAKEKVRRIMTEEKVNSLEKELETLRNLVESRLNEQKDDLKEQKAMIKACENDIGRVHANVSSLKTDINDMVSDIGSIRTDVRSSKGDTGERLRNFQAWIKTVEAKVENISTNDLKEQKAMIKACENDIGRVRANVSSLKTDINDMVSDIGSIRTDVRSSKGDTGERLRNFQAWIKTVEAKVENISTNDLKEQKAMIKACENDIGRVHANVSSLKTDINDMVSDIGSIRTDVRSSKGDTGERLRNFQAWIKTVEAKVENISTNDLKEQKATIKAFENVIGQVRANVSSFKTNINDIASDIGSIRTDVHNTKGDTGERLRKFEAWIKTVEGKVENISTTLKSDSPQIAFHARFSNRRSQFSLGEVIIFDDVYVDLGNGYQRYRGVFRVPIKGIYIVLMTVSSYRVAAPDYEVVRNGNPLCRAAVANHYLAGTPEIWLGTPCNAILPLDVGDEIWARIIYHRSTDEIRVGHCGPDQRTTVRACVRPHYPTEPKSQSTVVLVWEIWTNLQGYENKSKIEHHCSSQNCGSLEFKLREILTEVEPFTVSSAKWVLESRHTSQ